MNLFEAVSIVYYGDNYRIWQLVLYLIWSDDQAHVADPVFTLLLKW